MRTNKSRVEYESDDEFVSFSDITSTVCKKFSETCGGIFYADIFLKWREIVGIAIADCCSPLKITTVNDLNRLILRVSDDADILLLQYKTELIKERVNTFFGQVVINKISFITS